MMALVNAAIFFAAAHLGLIAKLKILVSCALGAAKRIFGIPDFRYYAIADGIREILKRLKQPFPKNMVRNSYEPIQLELALFKGP